MQEEMIDDLESFTCCLHGRSRFSKVDEMRHHLLTDKCGEEVISASQNTNLATLPPSRCSLKQHIRSCNYQVTIWKRGDQPVPDIPNPTEGYGWILNNGILEPLWTEEEEELALPQTVIDKVLNDVPDAEEEENDQECVLQNSLDDTHDFSSVQKALIKIRNSQHGLMVVRMVQLYVSGNFEFWRVGEINIILWPSERLL